MSLTIEKDPDDVYWDYTLGVKLTPYVPHIRKWWDNYENMEFRATGIVPILGEGVPPGLYYRCTNTPMRSPIKGVQIFPFVSTSYLQILGVKGGVKKMISRVCLNNRFTIEEFTVICKDNLPSTMHRGQLLAFVPTKMLENMAGLGRWIYLTANEIKSIMEGAVPMSAKYKMSRTLLK